MNPCEVLFGVNIEDVEEEHLLAFIAADPPPDETNLFEGKSGHKEPGANKHKETITAFLNTGGGVLWIGAPEEVLIDPKDPQGPKRFDRVPIGHRSIEKDDLRNRLLAKIEPLPTGIKLKQVQMDDGKYSTVVEVQQSEYPPHQFNGTYYIRLDGETRKAPHALVEALFYRRRGPFLVPSLNYKEFLPDRGASSVDVVVFDLEILNRGRGAAQEYMLDFEVEGQISWQDSSCAGRKLLHWNEGDPARFSLTQKELEQNLYPGKPVVSRLSLGYKAWPNGSDLEFKFSQFIKITVNAVDMKSSIYEFSLDYTGRGLDTFEIREVQARTIDGAVLPWPS